MEETHVVTVFLRNGTDVLLLRRSDAVGSYRGKWGADAVLPDGAVVNKVGTRSAALAVRNPTFDVTPAPLVGAIVTEVGALDTDDVRGVAAAPRDNEEWETA